MEQMSIIWFLFARQSYLMCEEPSQVFIWLPEFLPCLHLPILTHNSQFLVVTSLDFLQWRVVSELLEQSARWMD